MSATGALRLMGNFMPHQTPPAIPVGTIIGGKYCVERYVGDGGMGLVVAARHLALNELVAIKFMHQRDLWNPQAAVRFVREAQAVVKLKNNEHVARVHDFGKHDTGDLYIVMELLVGQDLGDVLKTRGVLPIHEACSYVLQACNALAEAHDLGIIHRDLKPANLFLTHRKDGSPCIKVLDFGISKVLDADSTGSAVEMTGTREMMGSPLYMSPEQAKSARDVDARTDIWALGAILYKLLTGRPPVSGSTVAEVSFALLESVAVRPPSEIRRDIPRTLDACILRCLEKSAHRRYGRITDLMVALAPFASRPSRANDDDDSAATVLQPMATRHSNGSDVGGTMLLAVAQSGTSRPPDGAFRQTHRGTDFIPAYQSSAGPNDHNARKQPSLHGQLMTQPLDGRALRAAVNAHRAERKPSFTGRVHLPPTSALTPNHQAAPLPIQRHPLRVTTSAPIPTIMPPPIPPAFPTGGYPIAPAARVTLPASRTNPGLPEIKEPPSNAQLKKLPLHRRHGMAAVALLAILLGASILMYLMRSSSSTNPEGTAAAASSPRSSAPRHSPAPSPSSNLSSGQELHPLPSKNAKSPNSGARSNTSNETPNH